MQQGLAQEVSHVYEKAGSLSTAYSECSDMNHFHFIDAMEEEDNLERSYWGVISRERPYS